ncbi:galanin receptor 2b isoform X1 [Hydra vulgaris]|uniref:galanin receptor 2b isoform X1 n=1 Tax=Hydra vulgaris TaxID=6087 RepID=UPI000640BB8E|nr:galanin receptor 2b [Hydra vulgaris]
MQNVDTHVFPLRYWEIIWYGFIALFGIVGNGVVMMVMILNKNIKFTVFNFTIFLLATTDFMVSFIGLPNYILSTNVFNHPKGFKGDLLCKLFTGYFWAFFFLDVSVFFLVYLAIERRKAIVDPFGCRDNKLNKKNLSIFFFMVILALALEYATINGMAYDAVNNTVGNFCKFKYSSLQSVYVYLFVFILETIVPVVILLLCYHQTISSIKRSNVFLTANSACDKRRSLKILGSRLKSVQTLKIVNIAFFVCVVPNNLFYFLYHLGVNLHWNSVIYQIAVLIRFSNACINPFIYSFKSKQFKKNFWFVYNTHLRRKSK